MNGTARADVHRWAPALIAVWALAAVTATLLAAPTPVALPVTGSFLLLGPGLVVAWQLRLRGTAVVLTVAVGSSLAALVLVGQILLVFDGYRPETVVSLLTALTLLCCLARGPAARRRDALAATAART